MKEIYNFLPPVALTLAFSACSDDQDQVGSEYSCMFTVEVTSSNLVFSAAVGTGTLVFETPSTATVSVDAQWVSAVVSGNKIDMSIKKNPELEGRSALLAIKCSGDFTQIIAQQRGTMFEYGGKTSQFAYNSVARTASVPVKNEGSNLSVKGSDWVDASINDETINVKLPKNKTGHIWSDAIKHTIGSYTDPIHICQGEKKDIVNRTYHLGGYDLFKVIENTKSTDEVFSVARVAVAGVKGQLPIYFPDTNWILSMRLDEGSLSLDINAGERMDVCYSYYHVFLGVINYACLVSLRKNEISFASVSVESKLSISGYFNCSKKQSATIALTSGNKLNNALTK